MIYKTNQKVFNIGETPHFCETFIIPYTKVINAGVWKGHIDSFVVGGGGGGPDHQADDNMHPIETVIATQNMSVPRESNGKGAIFVPS